MSRRAVPIPFELAGERADRILAQVAGVSRQVARTMIDDAAVTVDGRPVVARQRLAGGLMEFREPPTEKSLRPETVDYSVIFEDPDLLVVDKPAGIVVHPGAGRSEGTLAAGLLARYPDLEGVGQPGRWGLVHRLDKETSGLLLVARKADSYERLGADLKARKIIRRYLALVHGSMPMPTGTIDAPIGRDPAHPTHKRVDVGGRPARTHYRVKSEFGDKTLLELTLETGRTHQIRVHLAAIGHPVVGDRTYGRRSDRSGRMFLHAASLELLHPSSGERLTFESPLPPELAEILDEVGSFRP